MVNRFDIDLHDSPAGSLSFIVSNSAAIYCCCLLLQEKWQLKDSRGKIKRFWNRLRCLFFFFYSIDFKNLILCKTYIIAAYFVMFIDYISSGAVACNKAEPTFRCSSAVFRRLERCYAAVTCQAAGPRYGRYKCLHCYCAWPGFWTPTSFHCRY